MRLGSKLTVDLGQLATNVNLLKELASNEIIFMVKADAYGHGLLEVTHFAYHELGIKRFGCACLGEAMAIRKAYPQMEAELWVFSDSNLEQEEAKEYYLDYNIAPVIHALSDLKIVLNDKDYQYLPLILKFDTGMHRLGLCQGDLDEIIMLLKSSGRKTVKHLMTHFANSYLKIKQTDRTSRQYQEFLDIKQNLKTAGISIEETSCANSGAIEQKFSLAETHIRPGLMLYGPHCGLKERKWQGKPISTLSTKILKQFPVKKGTPIGYGGHVIGKDGHIIYLPLGYGDGILTYYSGQAFYQNGEKAQFIGRINMDVSAIFFENLPTGLASGKEIHLWDKDKDIPELAAQFKTSSYQLFTALTNRVPRRYQR